MAGTVDGNGMRLGTSLCLLAAGQLLASFGIQWYTIARLGVGSDTDALYAGSTLLQLCSAVVLDQVFFSLDADKFRQFTALLDAPPGPNPGLERLMAVKAPWNTDPA